MKNENELKKRKGNQNNFKEFNKRNEKLKKNLPSIFKKDINNLTENFPNKNSNNFKNPSK